MSAAEQEKRPDKKLQSLLPAPSEKTSLQIKITFAHRVWLTGNYHSNSSPSIQARRRIETNPTARRLLLLLLLLLLL